MHIIPEIKPQQSVELLKALHILTRDGKLNQDTRRKLKQVYHLYQFIEPLMQQVIEKNEHQQLTLVDHGAGKSYLGFILYDLFLKTQAHAQVIGVETRPELVQKSQALAQNLGFERMQFEHLSAEAAITSPTIAQTVDIVTALHACNTATDDAIHFGLKKQAQFMVLVPCCQAEIAETMRKHKQHLLSATPMSELIRHPLHTRELGSHLTNVLRCLALEAYGYQVTVTELVGWEHSMKNELIIARRIGIPKHAARQRLLSLLDAFDLGELQTRFLPE